MYQAGKIEQGNISYKLITTQLLSFAAEVICSPSLATG
jgi:hypothetical protein